MVEEAEALKSTFLSLSDEHTWILFSAILFVSLIVATQGKKILALLDGRTARIRKELEDAEFMKKEAAKLLEEYIAKHAAAKKDAENIIKNAEEYAIYLRTQAKEELEHQAQLIDKLLHERIKKAEHEAIQEINSQAVNYASIALKKLMEEKLDGTTVTNLDDIIEKIPEKH